jgi:hypothetical protein
MFITLEQVLDAFPHYSLLIVPLSYFLLLLVPLFLLYKEAVLKWWGVEEREVKRRLDARGDGTCAHDYEKKGMGEVRVG